jgi:hypothetical protein
MLSLALPSLASIAAISEAFALPFGAVRRSQPSIPYTFQSIMQLQTTRTFNAKGCRVDLSTWGNNLAIRDETDSVCFENVSQEELREAIRGYISSFRYSAQDDSTADQWLEQLTSTVADAIKERQNRKAKEATS